MQTLIPPKTFIKNGGSEATTLSNWCTYSAAQTLIRETAEKCNISLLHLGLLISLRDPHKIYEWTGGSRRPSPIYTSRIHYLALLQGRVIQTEKGKFRLNVFWIRFINWDTGEIVWKDGGNFARNQNANPVPVSRRPLQAP